MQVAFGELDIKSAILAAAAKEKERQDKVVAAAVALGLGWLSRVVGAV